MTDDQLSLDTSGRAFPDLDGLLPPDSVVTVTGPWTVRSCVTAACTNCGAVPLDEDTDMTPHFASTSQAAHELAQNWGWSHERQSCWPKDDLLLCPKCVALPAIPAGRVTRPRPPRPSATVTGPPAALAIRFPSTDGYPTADRPER